MPSAKKAKGLLSSFIVNRARAPQAAPNERLTLKQKNHAEVNIYMVVPALIDEDENFILHY